MIAKLAQECGYSDTEDCDADSLIAYKDALEDAILSIHDMLTGKEWDSETIEWVGAAIEDLGLKIEEPA